MKSDGKSSNKFICFFLFVDNFRYFCVLMEDANFLLHLVDTLNYKLQIIIEIITIY